MRADLGQFLGVVTFDEKDATCNFLGLGGILGLGISLQQVVGWVSIFGQLQDSSIPRPDGVLFHDIGDLGKLLLRNVVRVRKVVGLRVDAWIPKGIRRDCQQRLDDHLQSALGLWRDGCHFAQFALFGIQRWENETKEYRNELT